MKKKSLSSHLNVSNTPVSEKVSDNQVLNNTGGYVYTVSLKDKFKRFIILGSEGGTFYQTERDLTIDNAKSTIELIKSESKFVLDETIRVSSEGLARKNEPAILTMALLMVYGNDEVKSQVVKNISKVCRTGTHLFILAGYIKDLRGWGSTVKKLFKSWYSKDVSNLTYQMIKYQNRNGWNHGDMLKLNHIKPSTPEYDLLFHWVLTGELNKGELKVEAFENLKLLVGFELAKKCKTEKEIIPLIKQYGLTREMIPTEFLNKPDVIETMLPNLGLTAIVRSLGSWTACGFLSNDKIRQLNQVVDMITNETLVKKSMLHPIQILEALKTYINGRGFKGNLTWNPIQKITDALDKAFYMSFKNVVPTGKNIMLAIDISGSMTWDGNANSILTPREISCAMAMVTARTEKNYVIKGFATNFIDLNITPDMTLRSITEYVDKLQMGSTDCSLPMKYATENKMDIDAFIVYTDNETNSGGHPSVALKDYRKKCNKPNAKLIVCGITATDFTIADPSDPNMYDIAGGSSELPSLISTLISL